MVMSAPHFLASASFSGAMSSAMTCIGFLARAPAIMPSPMGPHPATTTVSSKVICARSTACSEQDSGSTNAACAGGMSPEILCTNASTG